MHYEESFQEPKRKFVPALVLIFPNPNESFVVYYDASKMGIGGVSMHNGKFVAYMSR